MRPDIYLEAMKEHGRRRRRSADMQKFTLFDGVTFDPAGPGEVRDGRSPSTA